MKLALDVVRTDGGTQSRAAISAETVAEYAEAIRRGEALPPVVVFHDGTEYWLADGFHRLAAFREAGESELACDVRQGTVRDAILHSVGANAAHGLPRTKADKRRAVEVLLRDEEWSQWNDREIARRAGVSHTFVSKLRGGSTRASGNVARCESQMTLAEATATAPSKARRKVRRKGKTYTMGMSTPRQRRRRKPQDEAKAVEAVLMAQTRLASDWKRLAGGWSTDRRLDMVFAEKAAAEILRVQEKAVQLLAALRDQCRAKEDDDAT